MGDHPIIGQSQLIKQVFELVEKAAGSDSTVLITGESGTGKELIAVTKAALPTANSRLFKINLGMILS